MKRKTKKVHDKEKAFSDLAQIFLTKRVLKSTPWNEWTSLDIPQDLQPYYDLFMEEVLCNKMANIEFEGMPFTLIIKLNTEHVMEFILTYVK